MRRSVVIWCLVAVVLVGGFCLAVRIVLGPYQPPPAPAPTPVRHRQAVEKPQRIPGQERGPALIRPETGATVPEHGSRDLPHAIACGVAEALGRRLGVAANAKPSDGRFDAYRIGWPSGEALTTWSRHPWSADDWQPVAAAMLAGRGADGRPGDTSDTARSLLNLTPSMLLGLDSGIGRRLAGAALDPAAHERAALIAAAFAWREQAGVFTDQRDGLAIACAHLAIARALGAGDGTSGRVAAALVEVVAGRESAAIALATAWPSDDQVLAAWRRVVVLSAGLDWKHDGAAPGAPLAERLAHVRALSVRLGSAQVVAWMQEHQQPALADWNRIAANADRLSVENGHTCALDALDEETAEAALVVRALGGGTSEGGLAALLDRSSGSGRIIPPAVWAGSVQRHLLNHLDRAEHFADRLWGEPDATAELHERAGKDALGLPLLPVLRAGWRSDPGRKQAALEADRLLGEHPERIPPALWGRIADAMRDCQLPSRRDAQGWFISPCPAGTTWGIAGGCAAIGLWWNHLPLLIQAQDLAPRHPWIANTIVWRTLGTPDDAIGRAVVARLRQLDYAVVRTASDKVPASERIGLLRDLAALEPDGWIALGLALSADHQDEEASAAFEHAFREATDRVAVANAMGWWVGWLLDHHRDELARQVAEHGRDVFSHAGLQTWVSYCERTGEDDDAEAACQDIWKRYKDADPLLDFWARSAGRRPASAWHLDAEIRRRFPAGRVTATLSEFSGRPRTGCRWSTATDQLIAAGMKAGDVVVAANGFCCENRAQYDLLARLSQDGPLRLIVWNGTAYREVSASTADRSFGCRMADHHDP